MKKHLLLAAAASLAFAVPSYAQMSNPNAAQSGASQARLAPVDQDFVTKALIGGMFEVQSSEAAQDKTQNAGVKEFAAQMIRDHGKANSELKSLANDLNAEVSSALDGKHRQALQKLQNAEEGPAFDRTYIEAQRDAHREAVGLFSSYAKSGGNPQLTSWAQKTLPVLQEHQSHVQQLGNVAAMPRETGSGRSAAEPVKKRD